MKNLHEYRDSARETLRGNWLECASVYLLVAVISVLCGAINVANEIFKLKGMGELSFPTLCAGDMARIFIAIPLAACLSIVYLRYARGNHHPFLDLYYSTLYHYWRLIMTYIMTRLIMVLTGIFTFGIMAFYFYLAYAMTPYLLEDYPDLTWKEAMAISRQMMDGHKWELFWLKMSFIGWWLLCLPTCGIGFFFLYPYIEITEAHYYRDLRMETIIETEETAETAEVIA